MRDQPVALVTGASRGIGAAIAGELGAAGHLVVVNYATSAAAARQVAAAIEAAGGAADVVQASVAISDDRDRLVRHVLENHGRLDVLVNNAGITSQGREDLLQATEASWDLVLGTNLKGPFFLSQLCAARMIDLCRRGVIQRGSIVNVSSISSYAVSTNRADYCIAKAAMPMMTWLFAARLAEEGIDVFEVCPGVIASDMTAPVKEKYDRLIAEGLSPIRRWGEPTDVAKAVRALVSGTFPYCTGQRIDVDGGFHIRRL